MAAQEFIVAIELGSSKITGIAGKKNPDGSINILAIAEENPLGGIKKGVVYNIDKTTQCLTNVINKLKTTLKTNIKRVYVGIGGQSMHSIKNVVVYELPEEGIISSSMVDEVMDINRSTKYPEKELLDVATQEYKVDNQYQIDPAGVKSTTFSGNFLNILYREKFYSNLITCFKNAGINVIDMFLSPRALADSVLTEAEKRGGCALIDIGAETTTIAVYHKNILRQLTVIPLGGQNITKDIKSLQMEEANAELLKLKYASAYTENNDINPELKYSIDEERTVDSRTIIELVEGRVEEIIRNAWNQIPIELTDKLLGGIVLTGGGAKLNNLEYAFKKYTSIDKIRTATFVNQEVMFASNVNLEKDCKMNTIIGLLAKGDANCAGESLSKVASLFENEQNKEQLDNDNDVTKNISLSEGVVITPEEKKRIEDEQKQREKEKEEEEERKRKAQRQQEREERRKNSAFNKVIRNFKDFGKKIIGNEDEQ